MTEEQARLIHNVQEVDLVQLPQEAEVSFSTSDDLEIKVLYFQEPGIFMGQHSHTWSHAHIVGSGALRVWIEGEELGDFEAGTCIDIEAGKKHILMSLKEDTRGFCVHNLHGLNEIPLLERAVFGE